MVTCSSPQDGSLPDIPQLPPKSSAYRGSDHAQFLHQLLELRGIKSLWPIAQSLLRIIDAFRLAIRQLRQPQRAVRRPVACEGRRQSEDRQLVGDGNRRHVQRVARGASKLRMPRSQSTTFVVASAMMCSAESSSSSIVAEIPRFSKMGFETFASSLTRFQFCMFRAPTWTTST